MTRFVVVFASVLAAAFALAFVLGPYVDAGPPICPFRELTGRLCVFCGMSHAVSFAVRGDFASACSAHPLWFVVLPLFAVFVAAMVTKRARLSWALVIVFVLGTVVRAL